MLLGARQLFSLKPSSYWGLCFTAEEANSTVAMQAVGSAPTVSLVYSTDGTSWQDFVVGTTTAALPNVGDKVWFKAKTTNTKMGSSSANYNMFVMKGKVAASGSIMSLLDGENETLAISQTYCFAYLFKDCSSLVSAPELPATTLANNCYSNMFRRCSSLASAPELPATTLAENCYVNMFVYCSSLTQAPVLPATTLASYCYVSMFSSCTLLSSINVNFTAFDTAFATQNWLNNVAANGTFTCPTALGTNDTITRGASYCPTSWTVVNK